MGVPDLLKARWATGDLVGDAAHACLVRIRPGYMNRIYQAVSMLDTSPDGPVAFPLIWKGDNSSPWQGQWTPTGDWITLENVQSATETRDFSNSGTGTGTLTVVIDNIAFGEQTGAGGAYHSIDRGVFSPTRGVQVNGRPSLWGVSGWENVFNGGYQIEVWDGYGQDGDVTPMLAGDDWSAAAAVKTFTGLIEDVDMESNPDHVTLTCRDFSVFLTDQRLAGWNKDKAIRSPVTFADRRKTMGEVKEFGNVDISSGVVATDEQLGAVWSSDTHPDPAHTEWIEIHLPKGHYESFFLSLPFDGETMYISLYARGGASVMDGTTSVPDGWVDLGLGTVPADGEPYIDHHTNTAAISRRWSLGGHTWDLGDNSVLRISFTNLAEDPSTLPTTGSPTAVGYRAGTRAFYAFKFGIDPLNPPAGTPPVKAKGWILVDDAADVVRMVLLWAGFHEFHVADFGWTLEAPMVFGQDKFLSDLIADILSQGNFVFYIDPPTGNDLSIGVPVFEPQSATAPASAGILTVRDTDLLEALDVKWDLSNAPYVIRYRGQVSKTGSTLFADLTKRYMGTYWPPWSGHDYTNLQGKGFQGGYAPGRVSGVFRQFSQTDGAGPSAGLNSDAECLFACLLAAIQYALQIVTGQFQISGLPGISLNDQISLIDEGTGTNARLWVASVQSTHILGPDGSWHMTIAGSIVDTDDMNLISEDFQFTLNRYVLHKAGQ